MTLLIKLLEYQWYEHMLLFDINIVTGTKIYENSSLYH